MIDYTMNTQLWFKTVCAVVMLVIGFGTMSLLIWYSAVKRTLIYWRMVLATAVMTTLYFLMLLYLHRNAREGHKPDIFHEWNLALENINFEYLWPFSVIPTVLYSW
jgi:hypothetical protein